MYLYLDTTQDETKLILYTGQIEKIREKKWLSLKNQSEELLTAIDMLLGGKIKDLEGIYVNIGPGSYTGSRVGITTANFLGLTLNIQPEGVVKEAEIKKIKRKNFSQPLLPAYGKEPFITKPKDRP